MDSARGDTEMWIINEAHEDRNAGTYKTYEAACKAMRRYTEEEMETLQPSIGKVLKDGTVTYEF